MTERISFISNGKLVRTLLELLPVCIERNSGNIKEKEADNSLKLVARSRLIYSLRSECVMVFMKKKKKKSGRNQENGF